MTAVFLLFVCLFVCFFYFLKHFYLLQGHSQTHKERTHHTEASWYLAASQAVIKPNHQSVITLSTLDFLSQFVWLLPPLGGDTTYVIFGCDYAIITGFPGRDHI